MSFEELAAARKSVQLFSGRHLKSIEWFQSGRSYRLTDDEDQLEPGLQHLTSTATCIESLLIAPRAFRMCPTTPRNPHGGSQERPWSGAPLRGKAKNPPPSIAVVGAYRLRSVLPRSINRRLSSDTSG